MEDTCKGAHCVNVIVFKTSNFDNEGKKINYHGSKSKKSIKNTDYRRHWIVPGDSETTGGLVLGNET